MRLNPRAADVAALAVLAKGRCCWPDCRVKIYEPVEAKYVPNCERAHIEAAEENGPRWNAAMSDEERRHPDNLIWLCVKHHKTVDGDPIRFTAAHLKQWKISRQAEDAAQKVIDGLTDERLQEVVEQAMDRLVRQLEELDLPGIEVAQMLVTASERLPDEQIANMLLEASHRMPGEDIAYTLMDAGRRLSDEETAYLLHDAARHMPDEGTVMMLDQAAMNLKDLASSVSDLNDAADRISVATAAAAATTIRVEQEHDGTEDPLRWFAGGVIVCVVILLIGIGIGIYIANR
jgi:hypothetical protein